MDGGKSYVSGTGFPPARQCKEQAQDSPPLGVPDGRRALVRVSRGFIKGGSSAGGGGSGVQVTSLSMLWPLEDLGQRVLLPHRCPPAGDGREPDDQSRPRQCARRGCSSGRAQELR